METRSDEQEDSMLVGEDDVCRSGELAVDISEEVEEGPSSGVKGVETNESSRSVTTTIRHITFYHASHLCV